MNVYFNKVVLLLILLCFFHTLISSAQENEKPAEIYENDPTIIDSTYKEIKSNTIQNSSNNESPSSIAGELNQSEITQRNILLKYGYLERLLKPWVLATEKLKEKTGLEIGTSYSLLYQHSSKAISDQNENNAASGVLEFFGHWNLFNSEERKHPGFLGFKIKWAHTIFSDIPPTQLNDQIGSLWQTTSTFNRQSISLDQIWWQQAFYDEKIVFRIGKVDQSDFVDFYMYSSSKRYFLNEAFSQNPTIPFPETGLLGFVKIIPNDIFYILFSLGDLNATGDNLDFKSFFTKRDYFETVEFNLSPLAEKLGYGGNYHITLWHSDEIESEDIPSSNGFNINLSKQFYDKYGAFIRYGYSDGKFTEVKQLLSLGFGISGPLNNTGDFFGMAFAWGDPVQDSLRSQYVFETLYRVQLTPIAQLTPDIQLIVNPTNNPNEDFLAVFGIRLIISL